MNALRVVSAQVPPDLHEEIKARAEREHLKVSDIVRLALVREFTLKKGPATVKTSGSVIHQEAASGQVE